MLLIAAISAGLASCADVLAQRGLDRTRELALAEIDTVQCELDGGTVRGVCMLGLPACVVPYTDAGEICTDSSECEGRCLIDIDASDAQPIVGTSATGVCQADTDSCGCWHEVLGSRVQPGICVD